VLAAGVLCLLGLADGGFYSRELAPPKVQGTRAVTMRRLSDVSAGRPFRVGL